jgi:hypothetical protein
MSFYFEKYPHETQNLLQYLHNIRLVALRFSGWSNYDRQFRLKQSVCSSISWQTIEPELWMLSMQPLVGTGQTPLPVDKPCFASNQRGFCVDKKCRYTHVCLNCKGQHPSKSFFHRSTSGEPGPCFQRPYFQKNLNPIPIQHHPQYPGVRFRSQSNLSRPLMGQSTVNRHMGPWKNTN